MYICNIYMYVHSILAGLTFGNKFGVATISRLLKIMGLFLRKIVSFIGLCCKSSFGSGFMLAYNVRAVLAFCGLFSVAFFDRFFFLERGHVGLQYSNGFGFLRISFRRFF